MSRLTSAAIGCTIPSHRDGWDKRGSILDNPYSDDPYKTAWQQGHDYGQQSPNDTSPQTPDFSSWGYDADTSNNIGQVWQEGALAGRTDAGASGSTDSGGASPTASGTGDGQITLPADLAAELADLPNQFPESWAMMQAGDGDTYFGQVVALASIPTSDDEEIA